MSETTETRDQFIGGLRALADFLESNPAIPTPSNLRVQCSPLEGRPDWWRATREENLTALHMLAREQGVPVMVSGAGREAVLLDWPRMRFFAYTDGPDRPTRTGDVVSARQDGVVLPADAGSAGAR